MPVMCIRSVSSEVWAGVVHVMSKWLSSGAAGTDVMPEFGSGLGSDNMSARTKSCFAYACRRRTTQLRGLREWSIFRRYFRDFVYPVS